MSSWRRRIACGAAIFCFAGSPVGAEVTVELIDAAVVVNGLSARALAGADARDVVRVAVGPDAPAILGDYSIEGDTLRFRPMFPFDPGREYIVRVADDGEPVLFKVSLPARDVTPTTVVTEIYPTSPTLPENQLKLYIHFSAPMAGGDGLEFVKLLDDDGNEVADPFLPLGDAFWDRDYRRYTVFFDPGRVKRGILPNEEMGRPIQDGRRYTLVVDSDWRDAEGRRLSEPYQKEILAGPPDETPIDPSSWTLRIPSAGTRTPLVVDFGEPLDRAVLLRALAMEGVDGDAELAGNETQWVFTPSTHWIAGVYQLVADAVLEDLAGNQIGKPFEVDVFERIDSPDDVAETHRLPVVIH